MSTHSSGINTHFQPSTTPKCGAGSSSLINSNGTTSTATTSSVGPSRHCAWSNALFNKLQEFFYAESNCDVSLSMPDGSVYHVNKTILSCFSDYFAALFGNHFAEANKSHIEIKFDDPEKVFPLMLRFIYTGMVDITEKNAIPLLVIADQYVVSSLKQVVQEFIDTTLGPRNAISILQQCIEYHNTQMAEKCIRVLARYFSEVPHGDFNSLSLETLLEVLQSDDFRPSNEDEVYDIVMGYISTNFPSSNNSAGKKNTNTNNSNSNKKKRKRVASEDDEDSSPEDSSSKISQLIDEIQISSLSIQKLADAMTNPLIPVEIWKASVMERICMLEKKSDYVNNNNNEDPILGSTKKKRRYKETPKVFTRKKDFDKHGVIYYIGTNGYKTSFENPQDNGQVVVTSSSLQAGTLAMLTSRASGAVCHTRSAANSWFQIDFGPHRVLHVTEYTLRHGYTNQNYAIRNWDLSGSMDGVNWEVISSHRGDASISAGSLTHSWKVIPPPTDSTTGLPKFFRYLRVTQVGPQANGGNCLVLSGFEFYGILHEDDLGLSLPKSTATPGVVTTTIPAAATTATTTTTAVVLPTATATTTTTTVAPMTATSATITATATTTSSGSSSRAMTTRGH